MTHTFDTSTHTHSPLLYRICRIPHGLDEQSDLGTIARSSPRCQEGLDQELLCQHFHGHCPLCRQFDHCYVVDMGNGPTSVRHYDGPVTNVCRVDLYVTEYQSATMDGMLLFGGGYLQDQGGHVSDHPRSAIQFFVGKHAAAATAGCTHTAMNIFCL
jgi:hypothetical protein